MIVYIVNTGPTSNRQQELLRKATGSNFNEAKGSYVTPPTILLQTTDHTIAESRVSLPGLDSMDKYLHLPFPSTIVTAIDDTAQRPDYKLVISSNETCSSADENNATSVGKDEFNFETDIFLLMTVKSVCRSSERRDAVRSSWGNGSWIYENLHVRTKLLFLLGACNSDEDLQRVTSESHLHSDILLWDFIDSFRTLTLKECLFLQWFSAHCGNIPFLFQGDDDILVNVENIVQYLLSLPEGDEKSLWVGSLLKGSPRITDPKSKYYVSKSMYPESTYPPYVSGGGHILSGSVAVRFFMESMHTRMIPIDDAFLGILAKNIGIEPKNVAGFESWGMDDPSPENLANIKTYHRALPKRLISMWNAMNNFTKHSPK